MRDTFEFLKLVLDALPEHIVVIDARGDIQYTNRSWCDFGSQNAAFPMEDWSHFNYLDVCDRSATAGDRYAKKAAVGIKRVVDGCESAFYLEYPCHGGSEYRWFMMRVKPLEMDKRTYFVVSHHDISERILAEEQVRKLAKLDGLTDIPNRRSFDEFVNQEWRRCKRLNKSICMLIIDIDFFKLLNDTNGHQTGDACLKKTAKLLMSYAKRPSDFCARYGGEEFAVVWCDMSEKEVIDRATCLIREFLDLKIPHRSSPIGPYLTISMGVSMTIPRKEDSVEDLIYLSDQMLYKAKVNGKNRIEYSFPVR